MKILKKCGTGAIILAAGMLALRLVRIYVFPLLAGVLFGLLLASGFSEEVTQTLQSPNGAYEAYVLQTDEGALGGSTAVYVKRLKNIDVFHIKKIRLQSGRYADTYMLTWLDEDTLGVNGDNIYEMNELW